MGSVEKPHRALDQQQVIDSGASASKRPRLGHAHHPVVEIKDRCAASAGKHHRVDEVAPPEKLYSAANCR